MSNPLIPQHYFENLSDIRPEWLREQGIRLLLADLDNTLSAYRERTASPEVHSWKDALDRAGITLFLFSNSRKPTRARTYAESLGVPYLNRAGKPGTRSFRRVMAQQGCTPEETAIVGDQIFTDVLGGNRSGVTTLLIRPRALDTAFRRLRFRLETPFRSRCPHFH